MKKEQALERVRGVRDILSDALSFVEESSADHGNPIELELHDGSLVNGETLVFADGKWTASVVVVIVLREE